MGSEMTLLAKKRTLNRIKSANIPNNWRIGLFTARNALNINMTLAADVTEAVFGGYARLAFTFGAVGDYLATHAGMTDGQLVWTWAGGAQQIVLGWFVVDTNADELLWIEDFPAGRSMGAGGDVILMSVTAVLGKLAL